VENTSGTQVSQIARFLQQDFSHCVRKEAIEQTSEEEEEEEEGAA
jgi:CO dehydrogenase/acetyl-CoA synthase beta subunit